MTLVIGHRGASHDFSENTLEAFRGAAAQGADWVELDVRRTSDGLLIVHHDAHLADGRAICDVSSGDLPASIPALEAALLACSPMGVNVEIKNSDGEPGFDDTGRLAREVVNAIIGTRADVTVLVSCFDLATLDVVKAAAPDLPTGFLTFSSEEPEDFIAVCVERGHQAVNPYDIFVTEASIARAHEHGIEVNVWTVDDPERIAELGSWGVDSVITNRPDVALRALGRGLPDPGSVPA